MRAPALPGGRPGGGGTAKHVLAGSPIARQMSRPSTWNTLLGKGFNPTLCLRPTSTSNDVTGSLRTLEIKDNPMGIFSPLGSILRHRDCGHRTEAQRRPKGQDAGGTPALPGDAVPAVRGNGSTRTTGPPKAPIARKCSRQAQHDPPRPPHPHPHLLGTLPEARLHGQMSRPSSICIPIPPLGNTLLGKGFNPEPRIDFLATLNLRPTSMEGE